jgi:hypothetical protein
MTVTPEELDRQLRRLQRDVERAHALAWNATICLLVGFTAVLVYIIARAS